MIEIARSLLVVDDDEFVRHSLVRILEGNGYRCASAGDVQSAKALLGSSSFDLVLCDIQMPGASGMELLAQISAELSNVATVMVTGIDDADVARRAIDMGAYGYVVKPFRTNEILINVMNALRRLDLERQRRRHGEELESKLIDRTSALSQAIKRLEESELEGDVYRQETVDRLTKALALRDEETGRHIQRVGMYCALLATKRGIEAWSALAIQQAGMLHDVGKIGVPDALLLKPGAFTPDERAMMQRHCEFGYQLLTGSKSPVLDLAATIALTHHERWDGGGYPHALSGEEIPIEGRITALADVFDALTSHRVYRPGHSVDDALRMIQQERGAHFDPDLTDLFIESAGEFIGIRDQYPDSEEDGGGIRVVIVDDQELFAEAVNRLLQTAPGIEVIGTAGRLADAIPMISQTLPDVVILDWHLPDAEGAQAARAIRQEHPDVKLVVLTGLSDDRLMAEALEAGCSAFLTKDRAFEDLVKAIRDAHSGEVTIPLSKLSSIVTRFEERPAKRTAELSDRELEILILLAGGLSNAAIAERLVLSLHTVRNHVQRTIMKMGAHSKLEVVSIALREGIIQLPHSHLL